MSFDDWFTGEKAAQYLGITRQRISVLRKAGRLTAVQQGHYWLYHRSELDRFIQARSEQKKNV